MNTTFARKEDYTNRPWHLIDAKDAVLGRLAVKIATILRGRHRPTYTPHTDTGDCVVVINADKVRLTGRKEDQKQYMFYSGYIGNEHYRSVGHFRKHRPEFIIHHAVKGMLPKNRLSDAMLKKLRVFGGSEHPHAAQNPVPFKI